MKNLLIITCTLCLLTGCANAAEKAAIKKEAQRPGFEQRIPNQEELQKIRKAHEAAFEQKLKLTEVQKLKAGELRKSGHAKIKPVIDDLRTKKQEAEEVRHSNLTIEEKEKRLQQIDTELAQLEKQAQTIRKQNMKEFESILTREQKKTLKNMKKEGRENFEKMHKQLPPPPCKLGKVKE